MVRDLAASLRAEAESVNERRLLVLTGTREACLDAADAALAAADVDRDATTFLGTTGTLDCERIAPRRADQLLGTTRDAVVYDTHDDCRPNALGRIVGAVDGGGLLVLLTPDLDSWPDERDQFDDGLAVPPYSLADVSGTFRKRLADTLRAHRGVSIYDADAHDLEKDGRTRPAPRLASPPPEPPDEHAFPERAYEACRTRDQVDAVHAFEALREDDSAVVVSADRGRGKSSAAGIATACLADEGLDVLVTAPSRRGASELFERARELGVENTRFEKPPVAADLPGDPDVVFVDEAAALPVRVLESFLDASRVAFTTTVHGYEGAGRGFDVRFRDRLAESDHDVRETRMDEPIRYAAGDPVEVWSFDALGLDARPPVEQLVADATPDSVSYERIDGDDLLADPTLLRETFGLLVLAHYRTEPDDLARLLDAPNLTVRALTHGGHVVSVALLAREGDLDAETAAGMYEGDRIRGNMIPDVLVSQVRDEAAAAPVGYRVVRIATHHAVRSSGLGSHLLDEVRAEFADDVDWLGVAYGATARLVRFWARNDYAAVHYSTTRNDVSGQYSVVMLDPCSDAGAALASRHGDWFARRAGGQLTDALDDADPDEVRAALAACDGTLDLALTEHEWRTVTGAAYGTGLFDVDPAPFRELVVKHLVAPDQDVGLTDRQERVLVERALQARDWSTVADDCGFHSPGQCMRALGDALVPLCDAYGGDVADEERDRHA